MSTTTTLTVLGSADAFCSAGRGNACYLVEDAQGAFCVDFGPTALLALKAQRFDLDRLDAVFLTHLHGDHFGGLHQLFIDAQFCSRRRRPLTIGGPAGTAERIEAWYRLAYGNAAARRTYATRYQEWTPGESSRTAGRRVRTFRAKHMSPTDGALCLRIEAGQRALAFSGDTGWTDELLELAKGADLFVCECTGEGSDRTHLSWEILAPRLVSLQARRILLSHLGEAVRRKARRLAAPPRVRFADDGLVIRLR